jgi:hypothetical protein
MDKLMDSHIPLTEKGQHPDYYLLSCSCGEKNLAGGPCDWIAKSYAEHVFEEATKVILGEMERGNG